MVVEVTGSRKLENGLVIPGTFKAVTRSRRLGAKFYEELNKVKQLCAHMDFSIKEMRSKSVRLWKDITVCCHISLKEPYRPYTSRISYGVPKLIFSRRRGGAYLKGGAYYKFWALGGALIRSGAVVWSWALIRAFTVVRISLRSKRFQSSYCAIPTFSTNPRGNACYAGKTKIYKLFNSVLIRRLTYTERVTGIQKLQNLKTFESKGRLNA